MLFNGIARVLLKIEKAKLILDLHVKEHTSCNSSVESNAFLRNFKASFTFIQQQHQKTLGNVVNLPILPTHLFPFVPHEIYLMEVMQNMRTFFDS